MVANIICSIRLNATWGKCRLVAINPSGIYHDYRLRLNKQVLARVRLILGFNVMEIEIIVKGGILLLYVPSRKLAKKIIENNFFF